MARKPRHDDRTPEEKARDAASRMLAMREHAVQELERKLRQKGFARSVVEPLMAQLVEDGLVSDQRFAEMLVHSRQNNGYGPVRIAYELRQKGVHDEITDEFLDFNEARWIVELMRVRDLKYGDVPADSYKEWAKRATFLSNRGFTSDQVRQVLGDYQGGWD